jgi:hypothetical protein
VPQDPAPHFGGTDHRRRGQQEDAGCHKHWALGPASHHGFCTAATVTATATATATAAAAAAATAAAVAAAVTAATAAAAADAAADAAAAAADAAAAAAAATAAAAAAAAAAAGQSSTPAEARRCTDRIDSWPVTTTTINVYYCCYCTT